MDNLYMGGRGIKERTSKLNDALWDAIDAKALGETVSLSSVLLGALVWMPFLSIPFVERGLLTALLITAFAWGWDYARPWYRAKKELQDHIDRMNDMTDRYGPGWAKD